MPAKNLSAVQKLAQFLHMGQRQYSRRTILQKAGKDPFGISNYTIIDKRSWPKREDTFAAIQLEVQNRNLSSFRKFGNPLSIALAQAKRGAVPKRNNILAKRNARKNVLKTDYLYKMASLARQEAVAELAQKHKQPREGKQFTITSSVANANEYYRTGGGTHQNRNQHQQQQQQQHQQQHQRNQSRGKYDQTERSERENQEQGQQSQQHRGRDKLDEEVEPQALRDVVFGVPDSNEDDSKLQLEADNELLQRISQQRPILGKPSIVSKRVIAPYQTYNSHRNSWAEFRHRMIYG